MNQIIKERKISFQLAYKIKEYLNYVWNNDFEKEMHEE